MILFVMIFYCYIPYRLNISIIMYRICLRIDDFLTDGRVDLRVDSTHMFPLRAGHLPAATKKCENPMFQNLRRGKG